MSYEKNKNDCPKSVTKEGMAKDESLTWHRMNSPSFLFASSDYQVDRGRKVDCQELRRLMPTAGRIVLSPSHDKRGGSLDTKARFENSLTIFANHGQNEYNGCVHRSITAAVGTCRESRPPAHSRAHYGTRPLGRAALDVRSARDPLAGWTRI
jgi:hypothetical protein